MGKYLRLDGVLHIMSRGSVYLIFTLTLAMLMYVAIPALAQQSVPANQTVVLMSGSKSLTIEDAVNYSVYDTFPGQSVHVSVITAQIFLNGQPYNRSGVPIEFSSDNDSVAVLEPLQRIRPTDDKGQAKILLIANNTRGIVNITAVSHIMYETDIRDTCTVTVLGWGTVSGVVTDKNRNGVPYANVTIWYWDGRENTGIVRCPDNPQLSSDGRTATIGTYTFVYVPQGDFNVTAEKDGHIYYAVISVDQGTTTANVAIPDYVFVVPVTPEPTVIPSAISSGATPTPTPTPTSSPGPDVLTALVLIGAVAVIVHRR
jgi:hypothetical protein